MSKIPEASTGTAPLPPRAGFRGHVRLNSWPRLSYRRPALTQEGHPAGAFDIRPHPHRLARFSVGAPYCSRGKLDFSPAEKPIQSDKGLRAVRVPTSLSGSPGNFRSPIAFLKNPRNSNPPPRGKGILPPLFTRCSALRRFAPLNILYQHVSRRITSFVYVLLPVNP